MTLYRKPAPYRKPQTYRGSETVPAVATPNTSSVHRGAWSAPPTLAAASRASWERIDAHQGRAALPWSTPTPNAGATNLPLRAASAHADTRRVRWSWPQPTYRKGQPYRKARAYRPSGIYFSPARSAITRAPWDRVSAHEAASRQPWAETSARLQSVAREPYAVAEAFGETKSTPWGASAPRARTLRALWDNILPRRALIALPWGPIGKRHGDVRFPWPVEPNPGDPGSDPITVPILPVYFMIPTLSAVRLPERTPVPLLAASLRTDAASWGWAFTGSMPFADFGLVNPSTREAPVELEVTINGYVWTVLVESFTDNRRFGARTVSLQGRSRSAVLAAPFAPLRSHLQSADRTAAQLGDEELVGTGWTLLWDAVDWLVPGGTYSYSDLAPIDALVRLAASIGARIETDRELLQLAAKPTYPISPWEWEGATPYAILPSNIVTAADGGWQGGTNANGVYVYSENAGFGALVKITGTAGELQVPQIVERLAVSADPARELGRQRLAAAGKIKNEQITTVLMPSPADPGLIPLGALLDVGDGTSSWRGQVMAVQVSAQREGSAFSVRQQLQVERHFR